MKKLHLIIFTRNNSKMEDMQLVKRQQEREDRMHDIRMTHYMWSAYILRFLFALFIVSCCVEIMRLSADDQADYLHAYHNPPSHCFPDQQKNESTWEWSTISSTISYPFTALYKSVFEPPITSDCATYFKRTNPMLLYMPRIPQALSNVITHFFFTPCFVFLDMFGDSLRHFMDKFNVAERMFGIVILVISMFLFSAVFTLFVWMYLHQPVYPSHLVTQQPTQQLTNQTHSRARLRQSSLLLQQKTEAVQDC